MTEKNERYFRAYLQHREVDRRSLFRGLVSGFRRGLQQATAEVTVIPRPPGALPSPLFEHLCTGCGRCADACPMGLVQTENQEQPRLAIEYASCDGCQRCIQACESGALQPQARFHTGLQPAFQSHCSRHYQPCSSCADTCPQQAISLSEGQLPAVDALRCNGCGECRVACYENAIVLRSGQAGHR